MTRRTHLIAAMIMVLGAIRCAGAAAKSAPPAPPANNGVVAKVGTATISSADLARASEGQLAKLRQQEYDIKRRALEELINQMVIEKEAAARGISQEDLVRQEIDAKAPAATDDEVNQYYEQNKARFPKDKTEEELKGLLRSSITQQKSQFRRSEFLEELRNKAGVTVLLDPPRTTVALATAPVRGPATAPVTIVEFSDFQCPFCSRVGPTVKQIEDTYGDKVRLAFRHYPLSFHPMAQKAAEAGACAAEQGKFWQMHDAMFANQAKLGVEDLKTTAAGLGVETQQFNQCLDSGKTAALVAADTKEGTAYGVSGTPAFFVNGRFVNGAQPYEVFETIINEELQRAGVPIPAPKPEAPAAAAANTASAPTP